MKTKMDLMKLRELAGTMSDHKIADEMCRSVSNIRTWAYAMNISLAFGNQPWSDAEVQAGIELRDEGKSFSYIAELFDRTPDAVRKKLNTVKKSLQCSQHGA